MRLTPGGTAVSLKLLKRVKNIMEFFTKAVPVWAAGRSNEMNCQTVFTTMLPALSGLTLNVTGASFYRIFVNGRFVHYGPARAARGCARVDEIKLGGYSGGEAENELAIEAVGYRCFSLTSVNQPSYICAEVRDAKGNVVACTGRDFECRMPKTHMQKVMRYSRQRQFSEVWDFRDGIKPFGEYEKVPAEALDLGLNYLPRRAPYPDYSEFRAGSTASTGTYSYNADAEVKNAPYKDNETLGEWGGWQYGEMEFLPFRYIQRIKPEPVTFGAAFPVTLKAGEYAIIDLGHVEAGFLTPEFDVKEDCDIILGYNENGGAAEYPIPRMTAVNVVEYLVKGGEHFACPTFEPYTLRYAIIIVKSGAITLRDFAVKRMRYPTERFRKVKISNPELALIWDAACRTFSHNAVDIYMDCPSRERGGWLCDSYFTSQVEYFLTGTTQVEDAFLENFVLHPVDRPEDNAYGRVVPKGMLPMLYPSDVAGSRFIPQWAMWYVLELEQYLNHRNKAADREFFRSIVLDLADYFKQYENSDGLLEKLPGWNFIEWSSSNKWGQDVNYPTNFLYAEMLDCIDRIYRIAEFAGKAAKIRKKTAELSFDGSFFTDNAVRNADGLLVNTGNKSEACQYYAIRFGKIDISAPGYETLQNAVYNIFGPGRTDALPDVEKANALMGIYLRMEILLAEGRDERLIEEIRGYFGYMAEKTGTLWEYTEPKGSLDHGFASFAGIAMAKALGER